MSEKHYPYYGGTFDRIVFDGDGSVWVPESEISKLREIAKALWECCAWETNLEGWCEECDHHDTEEGGCRLEKSLRELGIEVH
jgi:hypothetical protein